MILPQHSSVPFEVIHLDFDELRKKSEGIRKTQSFLLAIDEHTRMVNTRPSGEDATSIIAMMERNIFKDVKTIVCDNGPGFTSKRLAIWAQSKNIQLKFTAPYHPAANGMAERALRDIKQYIHMYPDFPLGWKSCLEAATNHHNNSPNKAIGCTPYFALHGTPPILHADQYLNIADHITLQEQRKTTVETEKYRVAMKKDFDRRHSRQIPAIAIGDLILVRKPLPGTRGLPQGPYTVVQTASKNGILKTVGYLTPDNHMHIAAIRNVSKYHPRRDELQDPGPM
ncbi:uncharacterized protein K02A2.6-like [Ornithodoros turicata]|uniref:uncharacterized protein K02A2.6-like n=1 Tax=Ornithodoros turicata TaxID=34597 RepID=UPI003138CCA8